MLHTCSTLLFRRSQDLISSELLPTCQERGGARPGKVQQMFQIHTSVPILLGFEHLESWYLFFFFFLVLPVYCHQPMTLHPHAHMLSHVTPWTAACQAPLSMDFSRQEYWSGLPFPSPIPDLLLSNFFIMFLRFFHIVACSRYEISFYYSIIFHCVAIYHIIFIVIQ